MPGLDGDARELASEAAAQGRNDIERLACTWTIQDRGDDRELAALVPISAGL